MDRKDLENEVSLKEWLRDISQGEVSFFIDEILPLAIQRRDGSKDSN